MLTDFSMLIFAEYSAKTSTKEVYDQLWDTLSIDLNRIGPPVRNSMEWRRIWSLYKYNQKRKGSAPPQSSKKRTCECQSITGSTQKPAYSRENIAIDQDDPSDVNIASEQDIPSQQNFPSDVECSSIYSSADLCAVVQLVVTKLDQILEVLVDLKSVLGRSS